MGKDFNHSDECEGSCTRWSCRLVDALRDEEKTKDQMEAIDKNVNDWVLSLDLENLSASQSETLHSINNIVTKFHIRRQLKERDHNRRLP